MYDYRESQYFHSLPPLLKEHITQSGVQFGSDDELRRFIALQNLDL